MQRIQLVYFCLFSSEYTDLNNIELTFSNKFKFHIQEFQEENLKCKIIIRKNEKSDIINEEFWGEEKHVSRVDLLVGENGAGKSTVMSYLSGRGSGEWFLIYLQEDGEKLNWYYKTYMDFSISIEIIEEWNIKKSIMPKEIDEAPFTCYYKPNLIARNWTCNEYNPDNSGLISTNRPSAVYNFVKYELKLLQKYFPAENLTYEFTIPIDFHFIQQLLRNKEITPDLKNILKTAVFMINEYSDYELNITHTKWINTKKIDEDYVAFRQCSQALLLGCFYQDRFSNNTINLLKMIIYVYWIIHCVVNLKNIFDLECP